MGFSLSLERERTSFPKENMNFFIIFIDKQPQTHKELNGGNLVDLSTQMDLENTKKTT